MTTKTCTKCEKDFPLGDFNYKNKAKRIRSTICRDCKREYTKSHYQENKAIYKKRAAAHSKQVRAANSQKMVEYLRSHPCADCGEEDVVVLQFDHIGDKRDSISHMVRTGCSWDSISTEIAKCEVRCANCHIRKTAKQFNWRWKQFSEKS